MITEKTIEDVRRWRYLHERDRENYRPWETFTMMVNGCCNKVLGVVNVDTKVAYDIVGISKVDGLHMRLAE